MNGQYMPGDVVLGNWKLVKLLGEGSFGKVYEAAREDFGVTYRAAVKVITIPQSQSEVKRAYAEGMDGQSVTSYFRGVVEEIVQEFVLMSQLKGSSHVVSYEDHMVIPHEGGVGWDILIRMELLTPLLDYMQQKKLGVQDVVRLGIDLCRALELCQSHNIIHRDVKPENVFVSDLGSYKLGDFGIARTVEKTTGGLSKKGTYTYMAPEVYKGDPYGPSVDQYSLGIVLYTLLNENRAPFLPAYPTPITHSDRETALARRMVGTAMPPPCHGDGRLGEIVRKACAFDPKARYKDASQLRQELESVLTGTAPAPQREGTASAYSPVPTAPTAPSAPPASSGGWQESTEKTESVFSSQVPPVGAQAGAPAFQPGQAPKKGKPKKAGGPLKIAFIACALVVVFGIFWVVGRTFARPSGDSSSSNKSRLSLPEVSAPQMEDILTTPGPAVPIEPLHTVDEGFNGLLWGEGFNTTLDIASVTIEDVGMEMKYGGEFAALPSTIYEAGPRHSMFGWSEVDSLRFVETHLETDPNEKYYGTLGTWSTYADLEAVWDNFEEENGSTYLENFRKYITTDMMDVDFILPVDREADLVQYERMHMAYEIEGHTLRMARLNSVDGTTFEMDLSEWVDYTYSFEGQNLILERNGVRQSYTRRITETIAQEEMQLFGWAGHESSAYQGVAGIEGSFITFTDGSQVYEAAVAWLDESTVQFSWEERDVPTGEPYTFETVQEHGEVTLNVLNFGDGFVVVEDGIYYPYQKSEAAYREATGLAPVQ